VLVIDISKIDFVADSEKYQELKTAIFKTGYKLGMNTLIMG
jgi:hypothetical protein